MSKDWDEDDSFEEAAPQLQQQQQVMQAPVLTKGLQAVERPLSAAELLSSDAKSITYETVTHYATLSMTPKELAIHLAKQVRVFSHACVRALTRRLSFAIGSQQSPRLLGGQGQFAGKCVALFQPR